MQVPHASILLVARKVRGLAAASTESAARVAPAVVRLQMLAAVREAWALRWPALALGPDGGSASGVPRALEAARGSSTVRVGGACAWAARAVDSRRPAGDQLAALLAQARI